MKSRVRRLTAHICVLAWTASAWSGCSSGAQPPAPDLGAPGVGFQTSLDSGQSISGEVLSGSSLQISCQDKKGETVQATFTVSGTASGPYPGTFAASGEWSINAYAEILRNLRESFSVESGGRTLTGRIYAKYSEPNISCGTFSSKHLNYGVDHRRWHGTASATINGGSAPSFNETLH